MLSFDSTSYKIKPGSLAVVGGELETCPCNMNKAGDECEDPTRGAAEAMTLADAE